MRLCYMLLGIGIGMALYAYNPDKSIMYVELVCGSIACVACEVGQWARWRRDVIMRRKS